MCIGRRVYIKYDAHADYVGVCGQHVCLYWVIWYNIKQLATCALVGWCLSSNLYLPSGVNIPPDIFN